MNWQRPDSRILWSWLLYGTIPLLPAAALTAVVRRWLSPLIAILFAGLFLLVFAVFIGIYHPLRCRRMRFCITEQSLAVLTGVFFRTHKQMPLSAVRYATLLQGPLERRFNIAFLWVAGAGGWVLIEGIPYEQAHTFCQRLSKR